MTLINLVSEKTLEVVSPSASDQAILVARIDAIKALQKSLSPAESLGILSREIPILLFG